MGCPVVNNAYKWPVTYGKPALFQHRLYLYINQQMVEVNNNNDIVHVDKMLSSNKCCEHLLD